MTLEDVSIFPILLATISSIVIGFAWYGPLFGKRWAKEQGWSESDMEKQKSSSMGKSYAIMTVGTILTAYVLTQFVKIAGAVTLTDGATIGLLAWLGFALPLLLSSVLWEGKSWRLYQINAGYQLVAMVAMGAILAMWG
jgi:Protein of unknown function (DUF1761)